MNLKEFLLANSREPLNLSLMPSWMCWPEGSLYSVTRPKSMILSLV